MRLPRGAFGAIAFTVRCLWHRCFGLWQEEAPLILDVPRCLVGVIGTIAAWVRA